jgi:hypothetical protein
LLPSCQKAGQRPQHQSTEASEDLSPIRRRGLSRSPRSTTPIPQVV